MCGIHHGLFLCHPLQNNIFTFQTFTHLFSVSCRCNNWSLQYFYVFCSPGILIGTLTMELGGVVTINCEKTGYKAEIEFKLKV